MNIAHNPHDKETYFSKSRRNKGYNQVHLNALYDLRNHFYLDAVVQPARLEYENGAFRTMVDRYPGKSPTIFIADRAYESYNNMAHVTERGMYFLIRAKDINSSGIISGLKSQLPDSDTFDLNFELILTYRSSKDIVSHPEIYKCVRTKGFLDVVDLDKQPYYPLKFRILKFPITDKTYECVITNLPQESFSPTEIRRLYGLRWGIETSFRELKYAVSVTNFHSKKLEYIQQEIWARLLLYNFSQVIIVNTVIDKSKKKHDYQVNFTMAMHICRFFLQKMADMHPPDVELLISKEILPIRPNRVYPRKVFYQKFVSFTYRAS